LIEILAMAGLATVQDRGRPGRMHEGVPPGGALVPELLARANGAVRNSEGEAGIELFGAMAATAHVPLFVATDEGAGRWLRVGQRWAIASGRERVRYVAVRGGIDVPYVLGGRGTLLVAGLGGHEGRPLRRGDVLPVGQSADTEETIRAPFDPDARIRVEPGPDQERFATVALEALLTSAFTVSARSDRVGVRLRGCALVRADGDAAASGPMVRGAIQVPASGEPIALGPDHPTTGGYPVLATVVARDVGALMARPIGACVRFALRATV
jgi:biotin-dependent carboxylase-like uncharacterized protein